MNNEFLKVIYNDVISYTCFNLAINSIKLSQGLVEDDFYKVEYDITDKIENNKSIITYHDINISEGANLKSNLLFDLEITSVFDDTLLYQINFKIINIKYVNDTNIVVFVDDLINNMTDLIFDIVNEIYNEYEQLDTSIVINNDLLICCEYDKNIFKNISIKNIFTYDYITEYDINISNEIINDINDITNEFDEQIQSLIEYNNIPVQDLSIFDDGIIDVDSKKFMNKFDKYIDKIPVNNMELLKYMIVNSTIRSSSISLNNLLALYDNTEYLNVNNIKIYNQLTR